MNEDIERKYALVTGGGSGLGRAFCLHLSKRGWRVAIVDTNRQGAEETLARLQEAGGQGQVEILDVRDLNAWQTLAAKLHGQWPRLDLLVNNAGICGAGKIGEYPVEDFRNIWDVNLMGVVNACHVCVPWLLATGSGAHIVNVASIAAVINAPTMSAYNTSKAAVVAFSETLYGELLPAGVSVTVVMPGFFGSQLLDDGEFHDESLRQIAKGYTSSASFTAEDVVLQTMKALGRRKLYVVLGRKARIAWRLKRFAPTLFQKVLPKLFERDRRKVSDNGDL
jgi:NAD(P)-dependent dehydrogenase (short-subunit alcohol dehydrogenase family)